MKQLVTGDGGMVYCRDPALAERLGSQLYLGLREPSGLSNARSHRWWELNVSGFGRRAIMNDIASAIGRVQLRRIPDFVARRRQIGEQYDRDLGDVAWLSTPPPLPPDATSSAHFYWIQTSPANRDALATHLRERGIYTTFKYHPLHLLPVYGHTGALRGAEHAAERTLLLPLHQALEAGDVTRVIDAVRDFSPRA
jgi:aminotransferase